MRILAALIWLVTTIAYAGASAELWEMSHPPFWLCAIWMLALFIHAVCDEVRS